MVDVVVVELRVVVVVVGRGVVEVEVVLCVIDVVVELRVVVVVVVVLGFQEVAVEVVVLLGVVVVGLPGVVVVGLKVDVVGITDGNESRNETKYGTSVERVSMSRRRNGQFDEEDRPEL